MNLVKKVFCFYKSVGSIVFIFSTGGNTQRRVYHTPPVFTFCFPQSYGQCGVFTPWHGKIGALAGVKVKLLNTALAGIFDAKVMKGVVCYLFQIFQIFLRYLQGIFIGSSTAVKAFGSVGYYVFYLVFNHLAVGAVIVCYYMQAQCLFSYIVGLKVGISKKCNCQRNKQTNYYTYFAFFHKTPPWNTVVIVSLVKFSNLCTKNIAEKGGLWYLFTRPQNCKIP